MKRLLSLAWLATAVLAGSAAPSSASTFGLFYTGRCGGGCCNGCGVCIRPVNAFTPVCGGVGEFVGGDDYGYRNCSLFGKCGIFGGCGSCGKMPPPWGFTPYSGYATGGSCCYQYGTPIPGAATIIEAPAGSSTSVAGNLANGTQSGAAPQTILQPISYPSAYPAYPVYPMGYTPVPVWGGYPMPAYYPAPGTPQN
jgi:hypothetical protein